MSLTIALTTLLASAPPSGAARAQDERASADLRLHPLDLPSPPVVELSTTAPNSVACPFAGTTPIAVPALGPGLPSSALPPSIASVLPIGADGRARLGLPVGALDLLLARSGEPHLDAGSGVDRLPRFGAGSPADDPTPASEPSNGATTSSTCVAPGYIDLDGDLRVPARGAVSRDPFPGQVRVYERLVR